MKENLKEQMKVQRKDLVSECANCNKVEYGTNKCKAYIDPSKWWRNGRHCPLYPNWKSPEEKEAEKKKVNPLKASKRRGR